MNTYMTNFKGDLDLTSIENSQYALICTILLPYTVSEIDAVAFDDTGQILYFNGDIDNEAAKIESILYAEIAPYLELDHEDIILIVQGETPSDRRDLIIHSKVLYVRRYDLVPVSEEIFVP